MACKFDLQTKTQPNLVCIQTIHICLRQLIELLRLLFSIYKPFTSVYDNLLNFCDYFSPHAQNNLQATTHCIYLYVHPGCVTVFRKAPTKGEDARRCRHFRMYCLRHRESVITSLGELAQHRKKYGEARTNIKIFCGCCGQLYHKMDALAHHMNAEGFHLKKSKIPGYNRERFDLSGYLAEHPISVFSAASAPAATRSALPSSLLRGAPDIYRLPACCLVDAISAVVDPLLASFAPSSLAGSSCTTSTTVTASPNTLLGSVFTIRNPIPSISHTVTLAPATITRDPETPLRD